MTAHPRELNWDTRLHAWGLRELGRPFQLGETDCASLVRRAMLLIYGVDQFANVPLYETAPEALQVLHATGGVKAALLAVGAIECPITMARAGDVIITDAKQEDDITDNSFVCLSAHEALRTNPGEPVSLIPISQLWNEPGCALRMP